MTKNKRSFKNKWSVRFVDFAMKSPRSTSSSSLLHIALYIFQACHVFPYIEAQNIIEIDALLDSSLGEVEILRETSQLTARFTCSDDSHLDNLAQISPIEKEGSFKVKV